MAHESNLSQLFYPATVNYDIFNLQTSHYDQQLPTNNSWRGFFAEDETLNKGHTNREKSFVMSLYNTNQRMISHSQDYMQRPLQLRSCRYLKPCGELLSEFCNPQGKMVQRRKPPGGKREDGDTASWTNQHLSSMDPLELHSRKTKLLSLLEEVNRRYRRYCEQMNAITSSFESITDEGTAETYTKLASEAMSRHFRHLKDAIITQLHATQKALGEDNAHPTVSGATKGETPRLKLLDRRLRQQNLFQHGAILDSNPWRPQRGLPEKAVSILRAWLFEHFLNPYPNDVDKHILARQTGLSRSQVSNWFINARVRLWKPMIEEMYNEEIKNRDDKEQEPNYAVDQKQTQGSSPINVGTGVHKAGDRGKVSLTLGLQQNGGLTSFTMPQSPHRESPLLSRDDNIDEGQEGHFTILGEVDGLPYRNLIDADQLLHDLA
ncbi:BEL1-like homeodomain 4 [Rhynchospora pubera]|uniref:BEL1-like homeodomain 4 n=1 Tax=Rhynchospora pubera TaxID=906938 RepID=A0AAV8EB26_9POAL|nr:BEL1-like homeodomain 4 [Rhynchospora pubera]